MIGPTEELLLQQIRACKLPEPTRQYNDPSWPRKWKVDFAWVAEGYHRPWFFLDVEGAVHRMKEPFKKGADRRLWLSWKVHYHVVTSDQVRRGLAVDFLRRVFQQIDEAEFNARLVKHGVLPPKQEGP